MISSTCCPRPWTAPSISSPGTRPTAGRCSPTWRRSRPHAAGGRQGLAGQERAEPLRRLCDGGRCRGRPRAGGLGPAGPGRQHPGGRHQRQRLRAVHRRQGPRGQRALSPASDRGATRPTSGTADTASPSSSAGRARSRPVRSAINSCASTTCWPPPPLSSPKLPENAGEDSISILPLLDGGQLPMRANAIHHSITGKFSLREGKWKLLLCAARAGGRSLRPAVREAGPARRAAL